MGSMPDHRDPASSHAGAWDDFLSPPADAPPPPAPTSGRGVQPRYVEAAAPPPEAVAALGPPPEDAMGAAKWAYQMQMRLAHDVMMDPSLPPSRRRKEIKDILTAAAKWMTDAMRYDVAQIIERDRKEMQAKKRGRAAAKPKKVTEPPSLAKVIPISRDG